MGAAALALLHPERVDKLVLMSAAGLVASEENMQRIVATRMRAVEDPNRESIKAMFDHLIADERTASTISSPQTGDLPPAGMVTRCATRSCCRTSNPRAQPVERGRLPVDRAPALTIASGQDVSEYSNTSRRVADLMPNARVVEMPDVKHWPHFEDAATFNRISLEFLLAD